MSAMETDLASDFDFTASANAAEAAAREGLADEQPVAEPPDATTEPAEGAEPRVNAAGRLIDEQGRFVKADEEAEEAAEPEQPAEPEFYAGRYKTREETERGIQEAQQAAQRAQAERDLLARQLDEQRAQQPQPQPQPQPAQAGIPPQYANFQEWVDEAPHEAINLAWRQQDQAAYDFARRAWEEVSPGAPAIWEQNIEMRAQLAELAKSVQATREPIEAQQTQQAWAAAISQFEVQNPWFKDLSTDELVAASGRNPIVAAIAEDSSNPERQHAALHTLGLDVLQARGALNTTISTTVQDVARTQAEEAQRARQDAFTPSSATATAQEPVSREEQLRQAMEAQVAARNTKWQNGWDGWSPGTPR